MQILRRLFSKRLPDPAGPPFPPPRPDEPLAVIGDIHGRVDLLNRMLANLDKNHPGSRKIFVGDYVDRGPDSRAVLERLHGLTDAICLLGNHEQMLLDFLDSPAENAPRWLRNGGRETLASYGIDLPGDDPDEIVEAKRKLVSAATNGTFDWLRTLPLHWQSGNLLVTHAGPNPAEPIETQPDFVFTWGHSRFLREVRSDGLWVAHGHWVQDRPVIADGRIAVDTGAWFSGRLTAALIQPDGETRFLSSRM